MTTTELSIIILLSILILSTMVLTTVFFKKTKNKKYKFKIGDRVKCLGVGYPHWKSLEFTVDEVFSDNKIGFNNNIKVSADDFIKVIESKELKYVIHEDKFFHFISFNTDHTITILNPLNSKRIRILPTAKTKTLIENFIFFADGIKFKTIECKLLPLTKRNNIKHLNLIGRNCDKTKTLPIEIEINYLLTTVL